MSLPDDAREVAALMPRIVAVLEAAERLPVDEPAEEYGPDRIYAFCRGDAISERHNPDCRYRTLITALHGVERTT